MRQSRCKAVRGALVLWAISLACGPRSIAEDVVIGSLDGQGRITFNSVSNALGYRVEWSPGASGTWTNFLAAADSLDWIPASGAKTITADVPMLVRVVADVVAPPTGMVLIPAGVCVIGHASNVFPAAEAAGGIREWPQHPVYISAFFMDQHETTRALWNSVKGWATTNGYDFANEGRGKDTNYPVHDVSWYDAVKWCNARSHREGLEPVYYTDEQLTALYTSGDVAPYADWTANGYRLPTNAEWEKAARGGIEYQRFPWTDTTNIASHGRANYWGNSANLSYDVETGYNPAFANEPYPFTNPVGVLPPNGYGLYDMAGNVWELCWDWMDQLYYFTSPPTDPRGPDGGLYRVMRGGSWFHDARYMRCSYRDFIGPDQTPDNLVGFRCVRRL